ncbi:apolipoprotein D-like [Contarinia nasturtii]|uniref:apolipoprotein D-like n=1 Tax=Contarinia nasturtii TaxID=265458 RepID=UPI0012D476AD|nr:apolipoprotein D-like [Contarinia nasturtii]
MLKIAVFAVLVLVHTINGHTYHSGECPSVAPMPDFDMKKFLGIWYAIQKTSTASSCLIYNVTRGEEPGEYFIEQVSQHFALGLTPLKHEYSYTGQLTAPIPELPAKMRVKFPLNPIGESDFTIFMTDYETYAGIFTCQKVTFAHRQSATLLSRTRDLDKLYVDKMRTRLGSFNVDPYDLSIINQTGCPKESEDNYNIHIDQETFSSASIGNAVRATGSKIGDGVEWTLDATKKLYNQWTSSNETEQQQEKARHGFVHQEPNAEWVRF